MTTTDYIDILQHFNAGNPVESRPRGSAEEYKADPEPIWDFAGREYRKANKKTEVLWRNPVNGFVWDGTGFHPSTEQLQRWDKYVLEPCPTPPPLRNPENIDFQKYPIPKGYRVVTEEDVKNTRFQGNEWMMYVHGDGWIRTSPHLSVVGWWTYLCPIDWRPS